MNQNITVMDESALLQLPLKQDCPESESIRRFDPQIRARRVLMRNKETSRARDDSGGNENQTLSAAPD